MKIELDQFFSKDLCKSMRISDYGYVEAGEALSYLKFTDWLKKKDPTILKYLDGQRGKKRKDLRRYFPEFESAIVFVFSYSDQKKILNQINKHYQDHFSLSSYVFGFDGIDYHHFIKKNLNSIGTLLQNEIDHLEFKMTLDVHPVLERDLAYRAGLGWFGKNSMFISKKYGSFNIIGSLLFNQKISKTFKSKKEIPIQRQLNQLESDHCGNCTKCIDACPTDAINISDRTIIAKKCISNFTIEIFKEDTPPKGYPDQQKNIFGCDICQDVCPWNIKILTGESASPKSKANMLMHFDSDISNYLIEFFIKDKTENVKKKIEKMSGREFVRKFKGTPLERTGKKGLLKNMNLF